MSPGRLYVTYLGEERVISEDDFRRAVNILSECLNIVACVDLIEKSLGIPFEILADPRWLVGAEPGAYRVFFANTAVDVEVEEKFTKSFTEVAEKIHSTLTASGLLPKQYHEHVASTEAQVVSSEKKTVELVTKPSEPWSNTSSSSVGKTRKTKKSTKRKRRKTRRRKR